MFAKGVGLPDPVHADDQAEPTRASRLDAGERVLENRRLRRLDAKSAGPLKYESGAGFPAMFCSRIVTPSTRWSTNFASPVSSSTSRVLADDETTATGRPCFATASRYRRDPSNTVMPSVFMVFWNAAFLRLPRPFTVSAPSPSSGSPSGRVMSRLRRNDRTPSALVLPST